MPSAGGTPPAPAPIMPRRETQAAPPDDGHLGSPTTPEETLSVPEADQPERPPHLHRDVPEHASDAGGGVARLIALVIALGALGTYLAFRWLP